MITASVVRDVDKLETIPDDQLRRQGREYLEKHNINTLFNGLMEELLKQKPQDPLQFMIDSLTLGPEEAVQDYQTGLPVHRQNKLEQVFKIIDKDKSGRISLRMLQNYANKYGGEMLTLEDLRQLFSDFKPANELFITQPEFLLFFSKVSRTINNKDFNAMITEMAA